ncbi:hypothetical protein KO317_02250 [Candidatus Micrarchaeota archaeon]|jgi:hypothetical protein|nr:hypothetical protein [Candidatus Micrarchaeota archaeon]
MRLTDLIPKIEKKESVQDKFSRHLNENGKEYERVEVIFSKFRDDNIKLSFYGIKNGEKHDIAVWPLNFESCAALYTKIQEAKNKQEGGLIIVSKNRGLFRDMIGNGGEVRITLNNVKHKSDFGEFKVEEIVENLRIKDTLTMGR